MNLNQKHQGAAEGGRGGGAAPPDWGGALCRGFSPDPDFLCFFFDYYGRTWRWWLTKLKMKMTLSCQKNLRKTKQYSDFGLIWTKNSLRNRKFGTFVIHFVFNLHRQVRPSSLLPQRRKLRHLLLLHLSKKVQILMNSTTNCDCGASKTFSSS